jgi:hypothetical protein
MFRTTNPFGKGFNYFLKNRLFSHCDSLIDNEDAPTLIQQVA